MAQQCVGTAEQRPTITHARDYASIAVAPVDADLANGRGVAESCSYWRQHHQAVPTVADSVSSARSIAATSYASGAVVRSRAARAAAVVPAETSTANHGVRNTGLPRGLGLVHRLARIRRRPADSTCETAGSATTSSDQRRSRTRCRDADRRASTSRSAPCCPVSTDTNCDAHGAAGTDGEEANDERVTAASARHEGRRQAERGARTSRTDDLCAQPADALRYHVGAATGEHHRSHRDGFPNDE